jgi:hypothetical protein
MATPAEELHQDNPAEESGITKAQRKALLDAFRQERDTVLEAHLQTMDKLGSQHLQQRKDLTKSLEDQQEAWGKANEKLPAKARESAWAMEVARQKEMLGKKHQAELETVIANANIPAWQDYLKDKSRSGDVTAQALLAEIVGLQAKGQGAGLEGPAEVAPKPLVLEGLTSKIEKDGSAVHYLRQNQEVFADRGKRIEMLDSGDREIEAALRLATAKFREGTPLLLTGDDEFKERAAHLAGELGIPIRNRELQEIWQKGQEQGKTDNLKVEDPDIAPRNGIVGDVMQSSEVLPEKEVQPDYGVVPAAEKPASEPAAQNLTREDALPLHSMRFPASEEVKKLADQGGVPVDGEEILIPSDRYMAARAELAHADAVTRLDLLQATLEGGFSALAPEGRAKLLSAGLADERGQPTVKGIDILLVQEQLLQEAREQVPENLRGQIASPLQNRQKEVEEENRQQSLRTRNVDEELVAEDEQARDSGSLEQEVLEGAEMAASMVMGNPIDWVADLAVDARSAHGPEQQPDDLPDWEMGH